MKRIVLFTLALLSLSCHFVKAQVIVGNYPVQFVYYNPNGISCNPSTYPLAEYVPFCTLYSCQDGTVAQVGGGGGGGDTITSPNSTISVGGSSSATTVDINLSNPNIWLAAQALGSSTATTQAACDDTTKLATTAYVNGMCTIIATGGSPITDTAVSSVRWWNAASAPTYNLPTPFLGLIKCYGNYQAQTQAISLVPGSGVTIYYNGVAGTAGSATGLVSPGTAGDYVCLEGTSATTYMSLGPGVHTWVNH